MTIAERLRLEKQNVDDFDAVLFLDIVEKYFKCHMFSVTLDIKPSNYIKKPNNAKDITYDGIVGKFQGWIENLEIDFGSTSAYANDVIKVPASHYEKALELLKSEGFNVYVYKDYYYQEAIVSICSMGSSFNRGRRWFCKLK